MPETPEMVERVGQALGALLEDWAHGKVTTADLSRAAIQAMREPSDAQRLAAYEAVEWDDRWDIADDERWAKSWRAGIDAALAAPDEGEGP